MTRGRLGGDHSRALPARTSLELGAAMRAMRKPLSLDTLLADAPSGLSKSQLGRYERGKLPPLKRAGALDHLYGAGGWIEISVRSMWRNHWEPSRAGEHLPKRLHSVKWPGQLEGLVWIKFVPTAAMVGEPHRIRLAWGPWRQDLCLDLAADGVVLATGKARDESNEGVTMNIDTDPALFLLHGAGEDLAGETVIDIRDGWS